MFISFPEFFRKILQGCKNMFLSSIRHSIFFRVWKLFLGRESCQHLIFITKLTAILLLCQLSRGWMFRGQYLLGCPAIKVTCQYGLPYEASQQESRHYQQERLWEQCGHATLHTTSLSRNDWSVTCLALHFSLYSRLPVILDKLFQKLL